MNSKPKVCAVVLNVAGLPVMAECLRSLRDAEYPALEVVVVHNGPADQAFEAGARAACGRITEVIFTGANLGFAAGNNRGIMAALARGADYVLLLNDDAWGAPDFVCPLVEALEADPPAGFAGSRIFYASEPDRIWFTGARLQPEECSFLSPGTGETAASFGRHGVERTDYATACAVLVRRAVIERTGGLDERFFLYWEDSDWAYRAAAAGWHSLVVPASRVWHRVSFSSGGEDSPLKLFHKARGRLAFAGRHCRGAAVLPRLLRDAAWLALKSGRPGRLRAAAAVLAGAASCFSGGTGPGPGWLRPSGGRP